MSIETTIREYLEEEYANGRTHQEIADAHHISRSFIQSLLSGKRNYSGISLKHVEQMFPHSTLNLNGDAVSIQADRNKGTVNVLHRCGTVNAGGQSTPSPLIEAQIKAAVEAFRHDASDALLNIDIPPDALLKVLKTLKDLQT